MTLDVDRLIELAYDKQLLPENTIKEVCELAKQLLIQESNLPQIQAPCTLVGDVHGQFYDLLEIFYIGGRIPDTSYVFMGDYVDRGHHSVETITLLTLLKIRYPNRMWMIRGNHETRSVTQTYGFYAECMRKFGNPNVWTYFVDMFDFLVLGCVIDDVIFCVHGGLSPSLHTLDQIRILDRFREIPHEGPMSDLVWSDPIPGADEAQSDFSLSPRGAGYIFGQEATRKFLEMNSLGHICRAHQLCMEGYQILFDDMLSTVWSAPNYCYRAGNLASILEIGPSLERYFNVFGPSPNQQLKDTPKHPTRLQKWKEEEGSVKKRQEMESRVQGMQHSLHDIDDEYVGPQAVFSQVHHLKLDHFRVFYMNQCQCFGVYVVAV